MLAACDWFTAAPASFTDATTSAAVSVTVAFGEMEELLLFVWLTLLLLPLALPPPLRPTPKMVELRGSDGEERKPRRPLNPVVPVVVVVVALLVVVLVLVLVLVLVPPPLPVAPTLSLALPLPPRCSCCRCCQ